MEISILRRAAAACALAIGLGACAGHHRSAVSPQGAPPAAVQPVPSAIGTDSTGSAAPPGTGPGAPGQAIDPGPTAADWATYHGGAARGGFSSMGPDGRNQPPVAWRAHVGGAVYAAPVAAAGVVVVATEDDVVAGLDARTGAVRWSRSVGRPVPGTSLECGDISPSGITGTPVIDTADRAVHVVALVAPGRHVLVTLDLMTGAVRSEVTVDPPGLVPAVEQQRGALTMANGHIYVAYGGLFGDCGPFKGAVVSAPAAALDAPAGSVPLRSWVTTTLKEGGVWAPAGPTVAADGSLWVATGNGGDTPGQAFDGGDAVVHLSADLRQLDAFAPTDWFQASAADADLGSTSPAIVGGAILQAGKTGTAYLLDATHLGGVGGQEAQATVCGGAYGGTAVGGTVVYEPCRDGVVAVATAPLGVRWHGPRFRSGGPVLVGGALWVPDLATGDLVALDPGTGARRTSVHVGSLAHFATPGLAAGRLVMGTTDGTVVAVGR